MTPQTLEMFILIFLLNAPLFMGECAMHQPLKGPKCMQSEFVRVQCVFACPDDAEHSTQINHHVLMIENSKDRCLDARDRCLDARDRCLDAKDRCLDTWEPQRHVS